MLNYLRNKKILLGISGGIAAYKVLELIRRLKEHGAAVKVILTASGQEFVTPLSIEALGADKVHDSAMAHIDLARWADVLLVAPATANFIGKFANGIADDLLTTVCLATSSATLIAPAMNQQMWLHPATQHNIEVLQQRGFTILGPAFGSQACGEFGPGRMLEADELLERLEQHFAPKLFTGKHIVITAGPTQEAIDPVRFISNYSSGKMGYALASAALKLGARVTLISGPTAIELQPCDKLQLISVTTAAQMHDQVIHDVNSSTVDIFIACAAVADYRPRKISEQKIKKKSEFMSIELEPTTDIVTTVAALPASTRPFCVGFAAETQNLEQNARHKLQTKNLDLIIANLVGDGLVFNQDQNQAIIFGHNGFSIELPKIKKLDLAYDILQQVHAVGSVFALPGKSESCVSDLDATLER